MLEIAIIVVYVYVDGRLNWTLKRDMERDRSMVSSWLNDGFERSWLIG